MHTQSTACTKHSAPLLLALLLVSGSICICWGESGKIGINYGLNGDNLLSPKQTVALLTSKRISRIRMYEPRAELLGALANEGFDVLLGIPNEDVPKIAGNLAEAMSWITQHVVPYASSGISAIIVGNEWLLDSSNDASLLLPAMVNIYTALTTSQILTLQLNIKVSTSHAFNVLGISFPPSNGVLSGGLLSVLKPLLDFLDQTGSFFMVNVFPYFSYINDPNVSLDFALFKPNAKPVQDPNTKLNYTNLFDLQLDAIYGALETTSNLGHAHTNYVPPRQHARPKAHPRYHVVLGETGWPSGPGGSGSVPSFPYGTPSNLAKSKKRHHTNEGKKAPSLDTINAAKGHYKKDTSGLLSDGSCIGRECIAATIENARTYNQNLVDHVLQSRGTPAYPNTPIEAYVFEVFNEDLKPPGTEQRYGLFYPNGSSVYSIRFCC